jgi:hypothetical protein
MGISTICVNEMQNIATGNALGKSGIPFLCMTIWFRIYAGFEWCYNPVSQLDCFLLFLIWQSEILVDMQMFD